MRQWFVVAHRWTGLVLLVFLVTAGATGAVLAWSEPLERLAAPSLFIAPAPAPGTRLLDPLTLRDRVAVAYPAADVTVIDLNIRPGRTAAFFLSPKPGGAALADDEVHADPATGRIVGARRWGDIGQGPRNLVPFLLRLHYSLALGAVGSYLFGIAALLWTIDCFVGAFLTLPVPSSAPSQRFPQRGWRRRWLPAWRVRLDKGGYRLNFDLHRAGGLWAWALLFVFAWSSVDMNLREVYEPLTRIVLGYESRYDALPDRKGPPAPALSWRRAYAAARSTLTTEMARRGDVVLSERWLSLDMTKRVYAYRVRTSRDVSLSGDTNLYIDADTGRMVGLDIPAAGPAGNVVSTWIESLHTADAFGGWYRIVVSMVGITVVVLNVTGLLIWLRKRRARTLQRVRSPGR